MYENQYQRKLEPPVEFLILIGIWVGCFVIGSVAAIPIWIGMTGKSLVDMQKEMFNPANVDAVKMMQVVSTIIIFFVPAFITARIASKQPFERLGFKKGLHVNRVIVAILIMLAALPFVGFLAEVNKAYPITASAKKMFDAFESQYADQVKLMATFKSPFDYVVALFIIALMPAIVEEVFFRGGLQSLLLKWNNNAALYTVCFFFLIGFAYYISVEQKGLSWIFYIILLILLIICLVVPGVQNFINKWTNYPVAAIILTGLIFSAIHFSWYGFIPRVALGMVLGYIFYYTGNLWYSIIAHFFNNALMVTILYWQYTKDKKIDMEVGDSAPWWAGLISAAVLAGLFILLKKITATKVYPDSIAAGQNPTSQNQYLK
jgi:membrane protease YdiL (CAAX protease family)